MPPIKWWPIHLTFLILAASAMLHGHKKLDRWILVMSIMLPTFHFIISENDEVLLPDCILIGISSDS